ncbi:hypothetical protein [Piscirickettsia litoralis]|uniref:Uncharacterized protein n=1 Tax=Piscirickettsia litoralis TaxID=1891921 RepID=A0ABX3A1M8_9GAMM|nr:hypothetical protein [Piscirickettsia litoralis]ODN41528.1 hypothetical protein BGC07_15585 [Piscirickettsia litoralis]
MLSTYFPASGAAQHVRDWVASSHDLLLPCFSRYYLQFGNSSVSNLNQPHIHTVVIQHVLELCSMSGDGEDSGEFFTSVCHFVLTIKSSAYTLSV